MTFSCTPTIYFNYINPHYLFLWSPPLTTPVPPSCHLSHSRCRKRQKTWICPSVFERKKKGRSILVHCLEVLAHGQLVPLFWLKARQNTMAVVVCGGRSPLHWARKQRKRHRAKDKDSLPRTIPHGLCPPVRSYFQLSTLHNNAIKL